MARTPDQKVVDELRKRGDPLLIPRPVRIWVYGGKDQLVLIAERLGSGGWDHIDVNDDTLDGRWQLVAERTQPATDEAIHTMSAEIEAALVDTDGRYDGWETQGERLQ